MRFMRWISLLAHRRHHSRSVCPLAQAAPVAQQGIGQICVRAFSDINGDGTYTAPDEPLLADVTFILSNETGTLQQTIGRMARKTSLTALAIWQWANTRCRPGRMLNKVKGEATTPGQWVVPLAGGAQYDIVYGVQVGGNPQADQAETSSSIRAAACRPWDASRWACWAWPCWGSAGFLAYTILQRARSA